MNKLSPTAQQALRAQAHSLSPVVMISEKGSSDTVLKEIDRSLKAHELIKIRVFSDDRDERTAMMETICTELSAVPIQRIGKVLVVYRKNADTPKATVKPSKPVASKSAKKVASTSSRRRTSPTAKSAKPRSKIAVNRRKSKDD